MAKPNIFDRAVIAVAPVHAAKRAAARAALSVINSGYGNYGANLTKKSMRGWEFYGGSPKEDIEDNINVLRQRSRDAYMGIPTAAAALKTMRTNVIAGGLMPAPQIDGEYLGLSEEEMERLQAQIVREFSLWADTPVCDAERISDRRDGGDRHCGKGGGSRIEARRSRGAGQLRQAGRCDGEREYGEL